MNPQSHDSNERDERRSSCQHTGLLETCEHCEPERPEFDCLQAFADWLSDELESLEKEYADFATVSAFRSFIGR